MYLFVYGTLMSGYTANHQLKDSKLVGPASTNGVLYDLQFFPGMKDGAGTVHGELYEVDGETIELLDQYEGYRKGDDTSLYLRVPRTVHVAPDKVYYAQTYILNRDVAEYERIACGDWRNVRGDNDD